VLGLSYEELGLGIAKSWGLPPGIQRCMRKPTGTPPPTAPSDAAERIRWIALASNEIADVLLRSDAKDVDDRIAAVTKKYANVMGSSIKLVNEATAKARLKLVDLANAMDIHVAPGSAAAKLLQLPVELTSRAAPCRRKQTAIWAALRCKPPRPPPWMNPVRRFLPAAATWWPKRFPRAFKTSPTPWWMTSSSPMCCA